MKNYLSKPMVLLLSIVMFTCLLSCKEKQKSSVKARDYIQLQDRAITKLQYKNQVIQYAIEKGIYIDLKAIDSMYRAVEPDVQGLIDFNDIPENISYD